jgi:hypothetical protein
LKLRPFSQPGIPVSLGKKIEGLAIGGQSEGLVFGEIDSGQGISDQFTGIIRRIIRLDFGPEQIPANPNNEIKKNKK